MSPTASPIIVGVESSRGHGLSPTGYAHIWAQEEAILRRTTCIDVFEPLEPELRKRVVHERSSLTVIAADGQFVDKHLQRSACRLLPWPRPQSVVSPLALVAAPVMSAVVVGVDASEASRVALRWAAEEAWHRHLELHVVHAFPAVPGILDMIKLPHLAEELVSSQLSRVADMMALQGGTSARIAQELRRAAQGTHSNGAPGGFDITCEVCLGRPAVVLLECSSEALVVVGDRGTGNGYDTKEAIRLVSRMPAPSAICGLVIVPVACCESAVACRGCWFEKHCPGVS